MFPWKNVPCHPTLHKPLSLARISIALCVCMRVAASEVSDFCNTLDCSLSAALSMGFLGKNSGMSCHAPTGDPPDPGLNSDFWHSAGFFTVEPIRKPHSTVYTPQSQLFCLYYSHPPVLPLDQ